MLQSSAMTPAVAAVAGAPPSDHTAAALHHGPHGHPTAGFSPAAAAAAYQAAALHAAIAAQQRQRHQESFSPSSGSSGPPDGNRPSPPLPPPPPPPTHPPSSVPPGSTHLPTPPRQYRHHHHPHHHHQQQQQLPPATHPPHHQHHPHLPPPHGHPHHLGPPWGHPHHHETTKPRFLFKMPRVVPNQKEKFESDDLMKKHTREGEVRFTSCRDRPLHERQAKFIQCLREGFMDIAFISTGFNLVLSFDTFSHSFHPDRRQIDFEKEPGKVHIKSPLVVNGVCVRWKGYFDMERLDGVACMEFDEEAAKIEDVILREQVEAYNRRMKEFEEYRKAQQRHIAAVMGQHHALQQAAAAAAAAQQQQQASSSSSCSDQEATSTSSPKTATPATSSTNVSAAEPASSSSPPVPMRDSSPTTTTTSGGHLENSEKMEKTEPEADLDITSTSSSQP